MKKSENNIDAARNFIRAALDGRFNEARTYMLADSVNINYIDVAERSYQRADQTIKDGYRSSSINIISVKESIKDSVTVIIYSNSFKNNPDTLKVLKTGGQWLVDFKYLYEHGSDTFSNPSLNKNDRLIAPNVDSTLQRAKNLSTFIFSNVEKVDEHMMTKKQLKKLCDPIQKELDSLIKKLTFPQYEELKEYRSKLVSDMVDRKVERDRKIN